MAITYQTNDFDDWYEKQFKQNFDPNKGLVRPDNMSNADWEYGGNLFNAYTRTNDATNQYNSYMQNLNQGKSKSLQQASINYDKFNKYLPTQIKSQGLGGLGVSESSMLQAGNMYQNTVGGINSDYQQNVSDLLNKYYMQKSNIQQDALAGSQSIFDKYLGYERQDQDLNFDYAIARIEDIDSFKTVEDVDNYYNAIKDKINPAQLQFLEQAAMHTKQQIEKASKEESDKQVLAGSKLLDFNDKKYQLTNKALSPEEVRNKFISNPSLTKKLQEKGFSDAFDENIPNGYTVVANYTHNPFTGIGTTETWTYYNNTWYVSRKAS